MHKRCLMFFQLPTDNRIRSLLDPVEPASVYPMFDFIFDAFQRAGVIGSFRSRDQQLLLALDGTQYFSSQKLNHSGHTPQKIPCTYFLLYNLRP